MDTSNWDEDEYTEMPTCSIVFSPGSVQSPLTQAHKLLSEDLDEFSFVLDADRSKLSGLIPKGIEDVLLTSHGILELYPWQKECLELPELTLRENLLLSLPTSGGKTLISEVITLRTLFVTRKNVLIVVPFVSIVHERVQGLIEFAATLNFLVEEYAGSKGSFPPVKRRSRNVVYVATIEKALSLIYSLLDSNRLAEIGLVILDEVHYVGDPSRGFNLEIIILLLKFVQAQDKIQMIAMSATVGNLNEMAVFLEAKLFTREFRPIKVEEYVYVDSELWLINYAEECLERTGKTCKDDPSDPSGLGRLILQDVSSCLVFCPTKASCENIAKHIYKMWFKQQRKLIGNEELIEELVDENGGDLCGILKRTLSIGVAYHHSGLASGERKIIEDAYVSGRLWCICSTSTLAAGVNLPAERVFLKSPHVGSNFLTLNTYKQMVGRAGRPGMSSSATSVLFCHSSDFESVRTMIFSPMTNCVSFFENGLPNALLVALKFHIVDNNEDLQRFFTGTLKFLQCSSKTEFEDMLKLTIERLVSTKCLIVDASGFYRITPFGSAILKANLTIDTSLSLLNDLTTAKSNLILTTDLHLLYLVAPSDLFTRVTLDLKDLGDVLYGLSEPNQKILKILGVNEKILTKLLLGYKVTDVPLATFKKLYNAILLNELITQNPTNLKNYLSKYQIRRGDLNNLVTASSSLASSVIRFTEDLPDFKIFSRILSDFPVKIYYSYKTELIELMELPGVRYARAQQLLNSGYKGFKDVALATPGSLLQQIKHLTKSQAGKMITFAKMKLQAMSEALMIQAEEYVQGIDM